MRMARCASNLLASPLADILQDANDLTFSAGETIEIVEETNADWWTGRARGKQGLFPSNYVEKIGAPSPAPPSAYKSASPAPYNNASPAPYNNSSPAPYKAPPYQPAYQPTYQAPPPGPPQAQYMPYNAGSVSMQAPPPQQPPAEEPKKSKFGGKLGNTVCLPSACHILLLLISYPARPLRRRWCGFRCWCVHHIRLLCACTHRLTSQARLSAVVSSTLSSEYLTPYTHKATTSLLRTSRHNCSALG